MEKNNPENKRHPIFNSNDYDRGFKDGHEDGFAGREKNYLRMGKSLKFAIHGPQALNTYTEGYNAGYFVGISERHVKKDNTTINKTISVSAMQIGIDGQIELLDQMKSFLTNVNAQFEEAIKTQSNFLDGLESEGLDLKILDRLQDFLSEKRDKLNNLISIISDEEIPYVEQIITHLEETPR